MASYYTEQYKCIYFLIWVNLTFKILHEIKNENK